MPLVDKMAELKMIRSLQMRINIADQALRRNDQGRPGRNPRSAQSPSRTSPTGSNVSIGRPQIYSTQGNATIEVLFTPPVWHNDTKLDGPQEPKLLAIRARLPMTIVGWAIVGQFVVRVNNRVVDISAAGGHVAASRRVTNEDPLSMTRPTSHAAAFLPSLCCSRSPPPLAYAGSEFTAEPTWQPVPAEAVRARLEEYLQTANIAPEPSRPKSVIAWHGQRRRRPERHARSPRPVPWPRPTTASPSWSRFCAPPRKPGANAARIRLARR